MIRADAEPIAHVPPRKPIELHPQRRRPNFEVVDPHAPQGISIHQKLMIWQAVVSTAEASNASTASASPAGDLA